MVRRCRPPSALDEQRDPADPDLQSGVGCIVDQTPTGPRQASSSPARVPQRSIVEVLAPLNVVESEELLSERWIASDATSLQGRPWLPSIDHAGVAIDHPHGNRGATIRGWHGSPILRTWSSLTRIVYGGFELP